jgi:predicted transcriptional regulator
MRTTIDLQPDLHRLAQAIARDQRRTLSETINELLASVLMPQDSPTISTSPTTGLPTVRLGRVITSEDVRQLDDDE